MIMPLLSGILDMYEGYGTKKSHFYLSKILEKFRYMYSGISVSELFGYQDSSAPPCNDALSKEILPKLVWIQRRLGNRIW